MLLKLAKELTSKEKEERKQLPLNCSPTQLIEKNSRRSCNVGYFFFRTFIIRKRIVLGRTL